MIMKTGTGSTGGTQGHNMVSKQAIANAPGAPKSSSYDGASILDVANTMSSMQNAIDKKVSAT